MIKAIIVDDELHCRETLRALIDEYCNDVDVVAAASSVDEAKSALKKYEPDLLFLDIRMPSGNGFNLLNYNWAFEFEVIFTTAYDEYAVKAFRYAALDYLLKPISEDNLYEAIARFRKRKKEKKLVPYQNLTLFKGNTFDKIVFPDKSGYTFITINTITHIKADRNYSEVFYDNTSLIVSKALSELEGLLDTDQFIRVHRSFLVNKKHITFFNTAKNYVVLTNNTHIEVSHRKKNQLINWFR